MRGGRIAMRDREIVRRRKKCEVQKSSAQLLLEAPAVGRSAHWHVGISPGHQKVEDFEATTVDDPLMQQRP